MTKPTTIMRDQLYKEIWNEPATKLAERYGISGSMVARICKELNVPRPIRGHWAKLAHGYKVKMPKLPALGDGQKDHWEIRHTNVETQRGVQAAKAAVKELPLDEGIEHILHGELKDHTAIGETKRALKAEKPDKYGRVSPRRLLRHLNVSASEDIQERSYLLLNRFLYLCEYHGLKLGCEFDPDAVQNRTSYWGGKGVSGELYLKWDEFTLRFKLREFYTVTKITDSEKYSWDRYDYNPSGRLVFVLDCSWMIEGQTTWKDGKSKRVEDSLLMMALQVKKYFDDQFEKREEKRRQEELRRERAAYEAFMKEYRKSWNNQRRKEKRALASVFKQASTMAQANQLRDYIQACENRMAELDANGDTPVSSDHLKLEWLKVRLSMLDPFVTSVKPWDVIPQSVVDGVGA
jgi:hypothetical protein